MVPDFWRQLTQRNISILRMCCMIQLISCSGIHIFSQDRIIPFQQINSKNGLTAPVRNIIQDDYGFIWFGSTNGLYRFDGTNLKIFRNKLNDTTSISNNIINDLSLHSDGTLWIASNGGLCYFSYETQQFRQIQLPEGLETTDRYRVHALTIDPLGQIFFATKSAVHMLGDGHSIIRTIRLPIRTNYTISKIYISYTQKLYIGVNTGWLYCLDLCSSKMDSTELYSEVSRKLQLKSTITNIYPGNGDSILVSSWYGGAHIVYFKNSKLESYSLLNKDDSDLLNKVITGIAKVSPTQWWFVSHGAGIHVYNPLSRSLSARIQHSPSIINGLSTNYLYDIYIDKTGIIWIGSEDGVNIYDQLSHQFSSVHIPVQKKEKSIYRRPASLLEDKYRMNSFWVAVPGIGLFNYTRNTNSFEYIRIKNSVGMELKDQSVYGMIYNRKNQMVITMNSGVYVFNQKNHSVIPLMQSKKIEILKARRVIQDSQLNYWITAADQGVYLCNKDGELLDHFTDNPDLDSISLDNTVFRILEDRDGMIWIGTQNKGLFKYNPNEKSLLNFLHRKSRTRSIPDNNVYDIYEAKDNSLWIATENGLARMDKYNYEFKIFTTSEGLSSNDIFSITPDKDGKLWLGTNNGLSVLNPSNGSIINYSELDGLAGNRIDGASLSCLDGALYFSSNGMISGCRPSDLLRNEIPPTVCITSVKVHGREINLIRRNGKIQTINLSFKDNNFNAEYVALNYTHPFKNKYAYYLDGYDKIWHFTGNQNQTHFTNLKPGVYTLKLKASNNDNIWSNQSEELKIIIEPPFWKRGWFYVAMVFIISGIAILLIRLKWLQFQKLQQLRFNIARDLHDDVGSTLSSIHLMSSMPGTLDRNSKGDLDIFKNIQAASHKAMEMMNEIIWSIKPENDKPEMLLSRMRSYASEILESAGMEFYFEVTGHATVHQIPLQIRKDLFMIYKEALNNIVKHSEAKSVKIYFELSKQYLNLFIRDNGKGFDQGSYKKGNGLSNMKSRAIGISAEINIVSQLNYGTEINLKVIFKKQV
jgi:ligand-binding sensor domain-containing protein/anti-sigma regulatory factor (Ser/Thr protein kinase)